MRSRLVGAHAVLVELDAEPDPAAAAVALATWARARRGRIEAVEVVPAAASVLFDGVPEPAVVDTAVAAWRASWAPGDAPEAGEVVELPVRYDGPDLAFVAQRWGTDVAGVVARHTATELVSAFCGFAPGFAYLTGLPAELAVPRLESPRTRVPAGAVALADTWCGVYPTATPGGWRLLGTTDAVLWDPGRAQPALLAPGTRVRFRESG